MSKFLIAGGDVAPRGLAIILASLSLRQYGSFFFLKQSREAHIRQPLFA